MILRKLLFLLCAALLAGCGGLAGEPRIVASLPPATAAPTSIGHPVNPPDIARGEVIFAQNCTRCHGTGGKGNGELVKSGQISPPPDFTNPATIADQRPLDWYNTITNGNMDQMMPPWSDTLSEAERWDVAMYTYTLSLQADQIKRGRDLFAAKCATCDKAAATDLVQSVNLTNDQLVKAFPGLANKLTTAQGSDVAAYLRTLSLANADSIGVLPPMQTVEPPVSTPEVTAASTQEAIVGTVDGTVTSGTAGGTVPPDTQVTLFTFDANLNQQQQTTKINADGSFSFINVKIDSTNSYVVTANYKNQIFASIIDRGDTLTADMADGSLKLPVKIYELTDDTSVLQITGIVMQVNIINEQMEVAEVLNIKDTSDRAFITNQTTSDGRQLSVVTTLPPGAVVVGFSNNQQRYVVDQNKFTVTDTIPVVPGEDHTVQIVYLIPYKADAIIEQPMNYAVKGPVRLLLNPTTIQVTSGQLAPMGPQTLGSTQYQSFGGNLTLAAGDILRYTLNGSSTNTAVPGSQNTPLVTSNNLPLIFGGILVIVALIGGGLFLIGSRNRQSAQTNDQQVIDVLIRQIAELDADHEAGNIDDDTYTVQRGALKARLAALMERKK